MRLELSWPPRELSPNARTHFRTKAPITKAYREAAYWRAFDADALFQPPDGPVMLALTFHPPDKRRRDLDGMFSSIKAGLDGIADALEVNDHRFEFTLRRSDPIKGGKVVINIRSPLPELGYDE